MDIEITYTPTDLAQLRLAGRIVVVMDIVRASTTITAGLAAGCAGFIPVASLAAARRIVREHADEAILLGGERQGIIVPGFDLGNSPGEYHSGNVLGKRVAFTTTNGTRVIAAAKDAERVVIGALVNLEAVASYLVTEGKPVVLAAGGRLGRPAIDDLFGAGMLAQRLQEMTETTHTEPARMALALAGQFQHDLLGLLRSADSGRAMQAAGLGADIDFCAQVSVMDLVPVLRGNEIVT